MKITTSISGQDSRRLAEIIERRIRERIPAQTTIRTQRDDDPASPPSAATRRDRRS